VAVALIGMVAGGVITQLDADKLLAIAVQPNPISEFEVRQACWADNGIWRA
jgi:hypothetical protein